uniref:ISXO2-like transposase domain-containing protein n=1 Tax=Acrobeloides nanus TaxID=290746 RepID=A0A914D9W5_9BILA
MLGFTNLWVDNGSLIQICRQLEINIRTAVDWASYSREVLLCIMIDGKEKLGGPDKIVEIDESKFGKRKYYRGHYVEGMWVFGGYERGSGRIFMIPVEFRNADTLIPIIKEWIEDGTTIISDFWKAYNCLENEGFKHLKVNHSQHFKDPDSGAHTNSIESSWRAAKSVMSSAGRKKAHIPGNLAKYMFFKRCKELKLDKTREFYRLAGKHYNPTKNEPIPGNEDFTDDEDIEFD